MPRIPPFALRPLVRYDMKPVERALVAAAYERWPHPSWGPAHTYLLSPSTWSPATGQSRPLAFARFEPGSGGIGDWHYHPGDGSRVLLRSPDQLTRITCQLKSRSAPAPVPQPRPTVKDY